MTPRAVLMKSGLKPLNTARPVNTVRSVITSRPISTARPKAVNTARHLVNTVRANGFNAVKPSAFMSFASSAVTYTSVYTNSEPGRVFWGADDEEVSEGGISWVIVYGYDGLPIQPVPQDEDKREPRFIQAPDPDFVLEPVYLELRCHWSKEQMIQRSMRMMRQRMVRLTILWTGEMMEMMMTALMLGTRRDEKRMRRTRKTRTRRHLARLDSADDVPYQITVRLQASISLPPETEVERLLAMTTPSPSPPISLSPPSAGERLARCMALPTHSSPPPVPSPLPPSFGCPTQVHALRVASTQALIKAVTTALPSPLLPPLPPSLYIPPPVDHRDDIPESEQPPHKRLRLSTLGSRYEIGESSTARPTRGRGTDYGFVSTVDAEERRQGDRDVRYGIRDTWVDPAEAVPELAPVTIGEVSTRVVEIAEVHERDIQDVYTLLEDAQDGRSCISQRVDRDSQRVDLLMGDRMTLQETIWMVEEEAYASREAWAHSIGLSQATYQELQTHRNHVYAHETHIQAHQTQLQLQSTLIQTQHQVSETRFQMQ
ncbi:hypothetical protein Tco_1500904 [Tanacetum coccineum]